jgi:hypothetical protein
MSRDEKIKALNDMGINILEDCPSDYGFFDSKICLIGENCTDCWIKTLEGHPNER